MDITNLKITDEMLQGKGVTGQPNPMQKQVLDAQKVFDQLPREIIIPTFNALLDQLAPIDLTPDEEKPISQATQKALDGKVDKEKKENSEEYKVLSDHNFSDDYKNQVEQNSMDRHSHENKSILDALSSEDIANWNGGNVLTKDNVTPYEPTEPYHPATVKFVQDTVVDIGAADMAKAIYDPNRKERDIFAYADMVAERAREIVDDTTGAIFRFGIDSGGLYLEQLSDAVLVALHNMDADSHANLSLDGNMNVEEPENYTLAEHEVDRNAHENIIIDGNK